jgi:hypothetical protein
MHACAVKDWLPVHLPWLPSAAFLNAAPAACQQRRVDISEHRALHEHKTVSDLCHCLLCDPESARELRVLPLGLCNQ